MRAAGRGCSRLGGGFARATGVTGRSLPPSSASSPSSSSSCCSASSPSSLFFFLRRLHSSQHLASAAQQPKTIKPPQPRRPPGQQPSAPSTSFAAAAATGGRVRDQADGERSERPLKAMGREGWKPRPPTTAARDKPVLSPVAQLKDTFARLRRQLENAATKSRPGLLWDLVSAIKRLSAHMERVHLQSGGKLGDIDLDTEVFALAQRIEVSDLHRFNSLMGALATLPGAGRVMQDMINGLYAQPSTEEQPRRSTIVPDVRTYGKLILAYTRERKAQEAFAALDMMKQHGLWANLPVLTLLMPVCTTATFTRLLDEMRQRDLQPDRVFFAAAIDLFSRSHALDNALGLLRVMESEFQLPPDIHIFNLVLSACINAGDVQTGWGVREMMREHNVEPDTTTIAQLITLCNQRQQRWERKRQAWERDERQRPHPYEDDERQQIQVTKWLDCIFADIQQHRIVPDAMIFNALMSFWSPDIKRSWSLFQTMLDSGCAVTNVTYNVMLKRCRDTAECDLGLELWERMRADGIAPNASTFALLLQLCARMPDATDAATHARRVWDQMVDEHGRQPDQGHLGTLLHACGRTGDVDAALALLDDVKQRHNVAPVEDTFTSLLNGLTAPATTTPAEGPYYGGFNAEWQRERDQQYEAYVKVLRRAEADGAMPRMQKVKYAFKMSMARHRLDEAEWLLDCMRRKGLPDEAHQSFALSLAAAQQQLPPQQNDAM